MRELVLLWLLAGLGVSVAAAPAAAERSGENRGYDRAGRLTSVDNVKSGTSLSKFVWTLDAAGNPSKATTTRAGSDSYDAYEYDARNRLTASCYTVASTASDCTSAANEIGYAYDKVSNRTQEVRTGSVGNTGTTSSSYNSADQLTSSSKSGVTTNYSYDTNGNQTAAGGRSFSYDLADQLTSASNAGTTTTYSYDGDGNRLSATSSGGADTRFIWDAQAASRLPELILEQTASGGLTRRYLNGPAGAVSVSNSSASFYYHHDPLDNITDLTDATGAAQWRYDYEAYGAQRTASNVSGSAPTNPLRFNHQYLDPDTTLYNLRARQYDSSTGSFSALDPLEHPTMAPVGSAYLYVDARPTALVDPLGLCGWRDPLDCAKDAAAGAGTAVTDIAAGAADRASSAYNQRGGGIDGTLAAVDALNPVSQARRAAQQGYGDAGGGAHGLLEGFNRGLNPFYYILISSDQCAHAANARQAGHDCLLAAAEIAAAAGGLTGLFAHACTARAASDVLRVGSDESWGNPQTLEDHFVRHGNDFESQSAEDYAQRASSFLQESQRQRLPTKVDRNGNVRVYDPSTNTFGAYNPNGTTKTFYKPDPSKHGLRSNSDYWNAQPGVAPRP